MQVSWLESNGNRFTTGIVVSNGLQYISVVDSCKVIYIEDGFISIGNNRDEAMENFNKGDVKMFDENTFYIDF
jgi:hypothetical protein